MSWVRPDREILPDLPHTPANAQPYDAIIVLLQKLGRNCTCRPSLEPGTNGVRIHYAIRLPTAASRLNQNKQIYFVQIFTFFQAGCLQSTYLQYLQTLGEFNIVSPWLIIKLWLQQVQMTYQPLIL